MQIVDKTHDLKGVLLDIDGTLVLSNDAHARAWVEAFVLQGIAVRFEDVRPLIGMGADKIIPALAPRLDPDGGVGEAIGTARQQVFLSKYAPQVQSAPGARPLCQHMRDMGLQLVIASSAQKEELDVLLKIANVQDLVVASGGADDKKSKPSPDVIDAALKQAQLRSENAIMLGDTPFDIQAAAQRSVQTIAFRCGGWEDGRLRDAVAIYDDPADLLAHYEESPLSTASGATAKHGRR